MNVLNYVVRVIKGIPVTIYTVVVFRGKYDQELDNVNKIYEDWFYANSEQCQWIIKHSLEPLRYDTFRHCDSFDTEICIIAKFKEADLTFYQLKYG